MSSSRHIIKRQVIEIEVPSVESAWQIQSRISEAQKYTLAQALEEVFNSFSSHDEIISIDKLELDLGKLKAASLESDFTEKLKEQLREQLQQALLDSSSSAPGASRPDRPEVTTRNIRHSRHDLLIHFLKTGTVPWWYSKETFGTIAATAAAIFSGTAWVKSALPPLLRSADVRRRFVHHMDNSLMRQFLCAFDAQLATLACESVQPLARQAGAAPKAGTKTKNAVAAGTTGKVAADEFRTLFWEALIIRAVLGDEAPLAALISRPVITEALLALRKKENAVARFIDAVGFEAVIAAGETVAETGNVTKKVKRKPGKESFRKVRKTKKGADKAYTSEHEEGLAGEERFTVETQAEAHEEPNNVVKPGNAGTVMTEEQAKEEMNNAAAPEEKHHRKKKKLILRKKRVTKGPVQAEDAPADTTTETKNTTNPADAENIQQPAGKELKSLQEEQAQEPSAVQKKNEQEQPLSPKKKAEEEFVYEISEEDLSDFTIENAGLVLLWPYLKPYFAELGLVKDNAFTGTAASHRAVHLLQYLAAGEGEYEEHDLVFNKILCGVDLTEPIDMQFVITEQEKEESENLLRAVIDNWKAIGKTSIDGLRGTFLHKEGALKKTDQGWQLYIGRSTIDMLLDRLPWMLSMIRLPWCREMIYVEW